MLWNEKVRLRGRSTWKVFKNLGSKRAIGDILHVDKRRRVPCGRLGDLDAIGLPTHYLYVKR